MRRRLGWDECWMQIAMTVAARSECTLFQAGCVIVDPTNRIVATGYNGPPANFSSACFLGRRALCSDDCPRGRGEVERGAGYGHNCISIHAEANALLFCDRRERVSGTLYVNGVSCADCQKLIANSGVKRVVMLDDHAPNRTFTDASVFFTRNGIIIDKYNL